MTLQLQNLTIRPESVQSLYATYLAKGFTVNRRYQRKLVWNIEEKRAFVDSLRRGYPVPLFLFAELPANGETVFEIIDGMQRLNAVFSYLEGEFDIDGKFFDLGTIPETKMQLERSAIIQKTPKLGSEDCTRVVTYQVPLSIARKKTESEIDDVFRRINSFGKHLSKQELRQAGSTGLLAQLVRKTAASIRGDVSSSDRLDLSGMKQISITNRQLPYGIDVSSLFWVANKILTSDQVRESRDEELIADIYGYVLLSPKPASSKDTFDRYYNRKPAPIGQTDSLDQDVELAIQKHGEPVLMARFAATQDVLRTALNEAGKPFNVLMFDSAGSRVPRYFQVVFLAIYELLVDEKLRLSSAKQLAKLLDGIGDSVNISEGGRWSATDRENNVNAVKGIIRKAFKKAKATDPALDSWVTEFENILVQSKTENALYDFKQGFHILQTPYAHQPSVADQIGVTLAAMANHSPGATGYVIVGVADSDATAKRIEDEHDVAPKKYNGYSIFGIDHESKLPTYAKGLDSYLLKAQQEIKRQPLTQGNLDQILKDMRLFQYFDRHVLLFKVHALDEPCTYDQDYYQRSGPNNDKLSGEGLKQLFKRFAK